MVAAINDRLAGLRRRGADLGVEVSRIDIVALLPPLAKAAFDDVLTASQIADQTVAAARTDAARITQEAQRALDRSRSEAAAAAEEQVRVAAAETADVGLLHGEITPANRDSLLAQYYRDRIGAILRQIGHVTTSGHARRPTCHHPGTRRMTATTETAAFDDFDTGSVSLTGTAAKWSLGLRMLLSMVAAGLLCVAVLWRVAFPDEQYLADLVAGGAAVLVAIPVLSAGWASVVRRACMA